MSAGKHIPVLLVGFDAASEVFLIQDRVLRGIFKGKSDLYHKVLGICEAHDLFRLGIVATRELPVNPYPDLPYDLVLEHERIPFISYPHEWPTSMLKDAALFHIDLYTKIGPHDLTIKDWHPLNILFKGTEPVFVDFTSIIPIDNLKDEEYLTPPHVPVPFQQLWNTTSAYFYEMYRRMYVPYFLLPLYMFQKKRYKEARLRMLQTTLNTSHSVIDYNEVFGRFTVGRTINEIREFRKKLSLADHERYKPRFLNTLKNEIESIDVSLKMSSYTNYYDEKKENFSFEPNSLWTNKQIAVYDAIKKLKPKTVLDAACNTGWFSILAARHGCKVVAFDIDEACINTLYDRAKQEQLSILPLVVDITNTTPDVYPIEYENETKLSLIHGEVPLLLSAEKRLKCDMVLALAIIHHLCLGAGKDFSDIIKKINSFCEKYLILEFVEMDDDMVLNEPSFFSAYCRNKSDFDWYNLDNLSSVLKKHFDSIEIKDSHPKNRKILICKKF